MVNPKRIATRIAELEAKILPPPPRVCPECGAEGGGVIVIERAYEDGTATFDPAPPCKGCADVAHKMGVIRRIVIRRAPTRDELQGSPPPEFFEVKERGVNNA